MVQAFEAFVSHGRIHARRLAFAVGIVFQALKAFVLYELLQAPAVRGGMLFQRG